MGVIKNETPHKSPGNCKNKTIVTKLIKYDRGLPVVNNLKTELRITLIRGISKPLP